MSHEFQDLVDLASERLGAAAVAASDEFFASKDRLVAAHAPVWREGEYTDHGKWMDGWETRRRRDVLPGEPGFDQAHDWCIIRLGARGIIRGVDVETTYFTGNFPESCAIDTCIMPGARTHYDLERAVWQSALERSALRGDSHNLFELAGVDATHVRLNVFPDGGVARLRVYGDVVLDLEALRRHGEIDLASVLNGGQVVGCSDRFFGSSDNLIMPGQARTMAEGWETKRRRTPGHDWVVVRLAAPGTVARVEVDTRQFKGNAPGACSIEACALAEPRSGTAWDVAAAVDWRQLLSRTALAADHRHTFDVKSDPAILTHVRFNIYPDGGVSRLRLFGRLR
jgi:allantoicase